jgi:hypothetical protein
MPLCFVAVVMHGVRDRAAGVAAGVALVVAIAAAVIPWGAGLLAARNRGRLAVRPRGRPRG